MITTSRQYSYVTAFWQSRQHVIAPSDTPVCDTLSCERWQYPCPPPLTCEGMCMRGALRIVEYLLNRWFFMYCFGTGVSCFFAAAICVRPCTSPSTAVLAVCLRRRSVFARVSFVLYRNFQLLEFFIEVTYISYFSFVSIFPLLTPPCFFSFCLFCFCRNFFPTVKHSRWRPARSDNPVL